MNDTYVLKWRNAKEYAEKESATEQLKATEQMAWVRRVNNATQRAREVVLSEIIYR